MTSHTKLEPTPISQDGSGFTAVGIRDVGFSTGLISSCEDFLECLSPLVQNSRCFDAPLFVPSLHFDPIPCSSEILSGASLIETSPFAAHPQTVLSSDSKVPPSLEETSSSTPQSMRIHPYQHERWLERYQDLMNYHGVYGHCNVPYVCQDNPCLGQWVKRQRHQYKLMEQGQHSNLTPERVEMLSRLGFIWDSHSAAWEEKFSELKAYRAAQGHCIVPCLYRDSAKLSTWIKRQRRQYRQYMAHKPSTMDAERIEKLESLGFVWDYYGGQQGGARRQKKFSPSSV